MAALELALRIPKLIIGGMVIEGAGNHPKSHAAFTTGATVSIVMPRFLQ